MWLLDYGHSNHSRLFIRLNFVIELYGLMYIDIQGFPINAYVCNMALKKEFPKMFMRISDEILRGFFVNYKSIT